MRTIILDGYNVILRSPAFRPDEKRDMATARDKLVNLLSWALGSPGEVEFVIVFDGADVPAPQRRYVRASGASKVSVRFSRPPQKADDVIKELVDDWVETREVTVVTSDLEVAQHARGAGASVALSDLFAASLFNEHVESAINDALKDSRTAGRTGRATRDGRTRKSTGSPTARGSDAEDKPEGVSKKNAAEWLRLFEEQQRREGGPSEE